MMNTEKAAINYYVRLIQNQQWKLENVPEKYREAVEKKLSPSEEPATQSS